jgi:hypothetical protein
MYRETNHNKRGKAMNKMSALFIQQQFIYIEEFNSSQELSLLSKYFCIELTTYRGEKQLQTT